MTQRIDGTAFISGSFLSEASILVDGDTITYAGPEGALPSDLNADERVRHDGLILPGLVDIHCHGGGGFSFPDTEDPAQAAPAIAARLAITMTSAAMIPHPPIQPISGPNARDAQVKVVPQSGSALLSSW